MSKWCCGFLGMNALEILAGAMSRRAMSMLGAFFIVVIGFAVPASIDSAQAETSEYSFDTPVYDSANGSYYQVVTFPGDGEGDWDEAHMAIEGMTYKGRTARLGVIKDSATNLFIAKNFASKINHEIWIGLSYRCASRQLVWDDGTVSKPGDYSQWARQWYRTLNETCAWKIDHAGPKEMIDAYMPVYYTKFSKGFSWRATGEAKVYSYILVEYPPNKDAAKEQAPKSDAGPAEHTASDK
jgi:hypothetical protein